MKIEEEEEKGKERERPQSAKTKAASKRKQKLLWDSLEKIYLSPEDPGALGGVEQLYKRARQANLQGLSKKAVEEYLNGIPAYTLHRVARKKFPRLRIYAQGIDDQWQADLVDMGTQIARANSGMRYLLTCIDVFSKYAWVVPLKVKSAESMKKAFEELFEQATGRVPRRLQTDKGKEFLNGVVQRLLRDEYKVHHYYSWSDQKAAIVERFNRTLKEHMWRYFTQEQTNRYLEVLPKLLFAYNHRIHRSIGMRPADVSLENEKAIARKLYGKSAAAARRVKTPSPKARQPERAALGLPAGAAAAAAASQTNSSSSSLPPPPPPALMMMLPPDETCSDAAAGDERGSRESPMVRISKNKGQFEKGYMPNWSEEDFRVREASFHPALNAPSSTNVGASASNNIVYKLEDQDGETIHGSWYQKEIQPIRTNRYLIERVIRRRPIKNSTPINSSSSGSSSKENTTQRECFVKWKGWPNKFNSWIPESDISSNRTRRSQFHQKQQQQND